MTTPSQPTAAIQVARINARQVVIVTLITCVSGLLGALVQNTIKAPNAAQAPPATDTNEVAGALTTQERAILYRLVADALERDLNGALDGRRGAAERRAQNWALRRAVFLNVGRTGGDERVLARALAILASRGHPWIATEQQRLLAEYGEIRAARLAWLEQVAIPEARRGAKGAVPNAGRLQAGLPEGMRSRRWKVGAEEKVALDELSELQREAELLARLPKVTIRRSGRDGHGE